MATQLELAIAPNHVSAPLAAPAFPAFALTLDRTPAEILTWWDDLVEIFTAADAAACANVAPLDRAIVALRGTRTPVARGQLRRLAAERSRLLGAAEAVEFAAYAEFEATLSEFSPRLIAAMQAEGLAIADDDERLVAEFWDCLQRPALEWCAAMPLRELVGIFCRDIVVD